MVAAITNSKITINGANEEHLRPTIEKLKECGVKFQNAGENRILVDGTGPKPCRYKDYASSRISN